MASLAKWLFFHELSGCGFESCCCHLFCVEFALFWLSDTISLLFKKKFMAPFYGWGSTASRLKPLQGGSLLFTTKFQEIPGTYFIDHGRIKG